MYIALFVQHHSNQTKKEEVTKFIVNLLRINQNIEIKNCNPIQVLVKKVRKSSYQDFEKQAEDHDEESELNRKSFVIFREWRLNRN
jgi:hypothetical protein